MGVALAPRRWGRIRVEPSSGIRKWPQSFKNPGCGHRLRQRVGPGGAGPRDTSSQGQAGRGGAAPA